MKIKNNGMVLGPQSVHVNSCHAGICCTDVIAGVRAAICHAGVCAGICPAGVCAGVHRVGVRITAARLLHGRRSCHH